MKLIFDIGNSRIKWCAYVSGEIQSSSSMSAVGVDSLKLNERIQFSDKPESIWISNVGSQKILSIVIEWCDEVYQLQPEIIKVSESCCGIQNKYKTQGTLGVDRWVAAIGARTIIKSGDVIIIDAGTAVTIDWLSKNDAFEGGAILPGFNLMHKTLTNNTAGIKSEFSETQQVIGRTTADAVNSGVSIGLVGAIERVVKGIAGNINAPAAVILTGGSAPLIEDMTELDMVVQKDLVLCGVANIASQVR